jgi:hypothetical protein
MKKADEKKKLNFIIFGVILIIVIVIICVSVLGKKEPDEVIATGSGNEWHQDDINQDVPDVATYTDQVSEE